MYTSIAHDHSSYMYVGVFWVGLLVMQRVGVPPVPRRGKIPRGFPVCITQKYNTKMMIPQAEALRELTDTLVDVLQHESNVIATKC